MNRIIVLLAMLLLMYAAPSAYATRLPEGVVHIVKQNFKGCKFRIDGAVETSDGQLFLPVIPPTAGGGHTKLSFAYPDTDKPDLLTFDNGYCLIKLERVGTYRTISLPPHLPDSVRHQIVTGQLPEDLVVPEAFVLPQSLSGLKNKLDVRVVADKLLTEHPASEFSKNTTLAKSEAEEASNVILVTSVRSGSIVMLDPRTLEKISEFPTEGTPTSVVYVGGKAYIADEGKNRVLILDCEKREFLGQIDLLPKSAPRDIARLPNGRLLYLSESSAGDIAIIETATHKILLRTKVAAGPGKIAITPNGELLLVLHGPSGQLSILSTANQRLLIHLKVGTSPSNIVVTSDSQTAYVANRSSNSISIIDLGKKQVLGSIATGVGPTGLALSRDNFTLYVANARENSLGIYNMKNHKRVDLLKLPSDVDFPSNMTLSPDGKQLFITSEGTTALAVFNTLLQKFEQPIQVGYASHQVLFVH